MNTTTAEPRIYDRLGVLGDEVRSRILLLLEGGELTVSEIQSVLQIPQPTVSRHLKTLFEDGWVVSRSEGTSRPYRLAELDASQEALWSVVRQEVRDTAPARRDRERARAVRAERRQRSREFFASQAGRWDDLRNELFGARSEWLPLLGLLPPEWTVGDLGVGTGHFSALVAPLVSRVIGIDASVPMLEAAEHRLEPFGNVELRQGELERLPLEDGSLDLAVMLFVLHYVVDPGEALAEARRVLRPGGRLVVVDMREHEREEYREEMGHLWPGFPEAQMRGWMEEAGLDQVRRRPLPADPAATGPLLFAASAVRSPEGR
ncbi:MAG: metalloregulator ArsR/SmtB family transcription factor [Longimicrobiales bacterium]|nr:metalloregulator ArsR/SmtB family transcription factor [Longimicrobiales bacterium]